MNSSLTNLKNLGILCTAAASLFLAATPSHAIKISFENTDFTTVEGTVDNDASSGATINTIDFGGIFTSDYLLLGAEDIDGSIAASVERGTSTAITTSSKSFGISSVTDDITLEFDWAFQGDNSVEDEFEIGIIGPEGFKSFLLKDTFGSAQGESITMNGFAPGTYQLAIQHSENGGLNTFNTAAGFDNVSADGVTPVSVPFEFSPSLGLIMMGGIFATTRYAKSRKAKQELLNI